jgi:predicted GIY-YIG superfamily endonuclease
MDHIYILKLKEGKYYIGKTKNIEKRWNEHLIGEGSGWTKKYKPVLLMKIIVSTSYFDEDKYVKEYMAKYGINNVRGGTYSNIDLDDNSISVLEKEIRHSKNLCTRCGRDTHFIKDCYAKTNNNGAIIETVCKERDKIKSSIRPIIKIAYNKSIITPKTIITVANNNNNNIIEFSNIRDYEKWCETDIAQNGTWKINVL